MQHNVALAGPDQPRARVERRRLPRSVGTDEARDRPHRRHEGHILHGVHAPEADREPSDLQPDRRATTLDARRLGCGDGGGRSEAAVPVGAVLFGRGGVGHGASNLFRRHRLFGLAATQAVEELADAEGHRSRPVLEDGIQRGHDAEEDLEVRGDVVGGEVPGNDGHAESGDQGVPRLPADGDDDERHVHQREERVVVGPDRVVELHGDQGAGQAGERGREAEDEDLDHIGRGPLRLERQRRVRQRAQQAAQTAALDHHDGGRAEHRRHQQHVIEALVRRQ